MAERIHQDNPVLTDGADLDTADAAVLLMHGRGATAESMQDLAQQLPSQNIAYVMPRATDNTWYPDSGFTDFKKNEPYLSAAWETIDEQLQRIQDAGIPQEKIVVGGFSQGACLMSEYVARHAGRYGGLLIFSGALMGTDDTPRDYDGSLAGTPVWVGGADNDPWVTADQLRETADVFEELGGDVTIKVHASSAHTLRQADIDHAARIIGDLT